MKVYRDRRIYFGRFPIEKVWLVLPTFHCVDCAGPKHLGTTYHCQVLNGASLRNDRTQDNRARDMGCFCNRRIDRDQDVK